MHRANEATEKYRSPREDDFSAAERASAAGADGHLSFPTATERGFLFITFAYRFDAGKNENEFYDRTFFTCSFSKILLK